MHNDSHTHHDRGSFGDYGRRAAATGGGDESVAVRRDVDRALRAGGLLPALGVLNARTRYRFTGLYRVDGTLLRNICLFDRENPTLCCTGDVSLLHDTFCQIVSRSDVPFATADARIDERVADLAPRTPVVSYSGVPVVYDQGERGTLCHFDMRPRLFWPEEVPVMESVASLFGTALSQVSAVGP
jgi:GAF domain-containing protein